MATRWLPCAYLACGRSKSELVSMIVFKLCIVFEVIEERKPLDFGPDQQVKLAAGGRFITATLLILDKYQNACLNVSNGLVLCSLDGFYTI